MRIIRLSATYSFDFDDTLTQPVWDEEDELWGNNGEAQQSTIDIMLELASQGHKIIIVTARREENLPEVYEFVKRYELPVSEIHATNHQPKGEWFSDQEWKDEIANHYDDCPFELEDLGKHNVPYQQVKHPFDLENPNYGPKS